MIGKRWGSGNQMKEIWNECVQLCHWKIGGINWQVIVCQVCHAGDELEEWQWSIEFEVSQSVRGFFFKTQFCVKPYVPRDPEGTQVIAGSMNMGYISDTVRNRTHNLIRRKRDGSGCEFDVKSIVTVSDSWNNAVQSFLFHLNQFHILGKQNNRSKGAWIILK